MQQQLTELTENQLRQIAQKLRDEVIKWVGAPMSEKNIECTERELFEALVNTNPEPNGYALARYLDEHCGFIPDAQLVDILDRAVSLWLAALPDEPADEELQAKTSRRRSETKRQMDEYRSNGHFIAAWMNELLHSVCNDLLVVSEQRAESRFSKLSDDDLGIVVDVANQIAKMAARDLESRNVPIIKLNAEETRRLIQNIENPPSPNEALKAAFAEYQKRVEGRTILFDDRERLHSSSFVGVYKKHGAAVPFLAASSNCAVWFKTAEGAARWYAQEVGLDVDAVTAAVIAANKPDKED